MWFQKILEMKKIELVSKSIWNESVILPSKYNRNMQSIQHNNGNNATGDQSHIHWIPPTEDDTDDTDTKYQMFTGETSDFGMQVFSDPRTQANFKYCEDKYKKILDLKHAHDAQVLLSKMRIDIRREYLTRKKQVKQLQMAAAVDFRNAHHLLKQHHRMDTFGGCKFSGVDISAPIVSQIQLPGETIDLKTFNTDLEFDKICQMHERIQANMRQRWAEEEEYATRGAFGGCYDSYDEEEEEEEEEEQQEEEPEEPEQQQEEAPEEPEQQQEEEPEEPEQQEEEPEEPEQQQEEELEVVDYPLERAGNSTKAKKPAAKKKPVAAAKAKKPAAAKLVKKEKFIPFQIEDNTNRENNQETLPASKIEIDMPKKDLKNLESASREDKKRYNQKWKRINAEQKFTNTRTHGTMSALAIAVADANKDKTTKTPITIHGEDGSMYEGFVNERGEKHGAGIYKTEICISGIVGDENSHLAKWTEFEGEWCDGVLHGQGVMREMSDKGVVRVVHDGMWDTGVQVNRAAIERLIMASLTTSREFDFMAMCDNQNGNWCCDE